MLVISNGAFKSGSTWLYNILRCMTGFPPPPEEFLNPNWVNPSIDPEKLTKFLKEVDFSHKNYLCKNHFGGKYQRDLLLASPNVFILDIKRDIRDVVVSAYYHHRRKGYDESFKNYYWKKGKKVANFVSSYQRNWDVQSTKILIASYEKLHSDFNSETKKIGDFLGIQVSDQLSEQIKTETTLDSLRNRYGESDQSDDSKFFRKGVIGDWQNHFDAKMDQDLEKVQKFSLSHSDKIQVEITKLYTKTKRKIEHLFLPS